MSGEKDIAEQLEQHLNAPSQTWLLGAGVSFDAKIPLMYPLTERVISQAKNIVFKDNQSTKDVIDFILGDIAEGEHIETFLTYLSDLISLAERSRNNSVTVGEVKVHKTKLTDIHIQLLDLIASTLRWGGIIQS